MMKFIKDSYIIILIFALGFVLRIYNLTAESIWFDEAFSAMASKKDVLAQIKWVLNNARETNPPFYYVLLHFWILVFGDSEFSLRFMSVIFGSVSIIAIYFLGKLLFNKRTGIIAALIIAVSVFHIQFSQEARGYTLTVFLTLLSFYSFFRLTTQRSISMGVLYLVSSILMIYTHYYGIFILAAQNLFCLTLFLKERKTGEISIKQWILLQIIVVLAFIPGVSHLLKMKASMQKSFWIPEPTLERLGNYLVVYSGSIYLFVLFVVFALISVAGIRRIASVGGLKTIFRTSDNDNSELAISTGYRVYFLILWFSFPILIPMVISIVSTPMFVSRYAISSTLAFFLLASKGIDCLKNKWAIVTIGGIILMLSAVNLNGYYENVHKHQWREVMTEIENNAGKGDIIIIYPAHEESSAKYYQTRDDIIILPLEDKFPSFKNLGSRRVWVITHEHPLNRERIKKGLSSTYNFELERQFVRLYLFRMRQK